jgi:hypothetical protein
MSASDVTPEHVHEWIMCTVCAAQNNKQLVCWCGEHVSYHDIEAGVIGIPLT